jgi:2,5-diamino-6-(ribosylamino)-4(3H)-pyrimidinone 5'-phosphate reductase
MYSGLYSSHNRIYSFEELALPITGIDFENSSDNHSAKRPYIAFNMVSSVDGKATTHEGKLTGLGSRPDRWLMKRLRSQFDAVLVGGETLRRDVFVPTVPPELLAERQKNFEKPQPLGIVISNSGGFPQEHRFWEAAKDYRVVLVGEETVIEPWLESRSQIFRFPTQNHQIDLKQVLTFLFEKLGVKRLLVEGGAALNYAFISQSFADEMFLSLAPHIVGGAENMTVVGGTGYGLGGGDLPKLKLRSVYQAESELFLRYQF